MGNLAGEAHPRAAGRQGVEIESGDASHAEDADKKSLKSRVLGLVIAAALLSGLLALGYVMAVSKVSEPFTEFYLMGPRGRAAGYPAGVVLGQKGTVAVGIINRENRTMSYRVEVRINGVKHSEISPIALERDQKWEQDVTFTPTTVGPAQVEFLLYKVGQGDLSQGLQLWVDVTK